VAPALIAGRAAAPASREDFMSGAGMAGGGHLSGLLKLLKKRA
jgi:hypothetical protein